MSKKGVETRERKTSKSSFCCDAQVVITTNKSGGERAICGKCSKVPFRNNRDRRLKRIVVSGF